MPRRTPLLLAPAAILILTVAAVAAKQDGATATDGLPLHERMLAELRQPQGAVTRVLPQVHPMVTAYNHEAPIPPQCYTKTDGHHNPCYVCHQAAIPERENVMDDADLQEAYSFSDVGMDNHWHNLFEDRSAAVAAISDEEIRAWIDQDNYAALPGRLRAEGFEGWVPDLAGLAEGAAAFDDNGFAKDGSHWVAFNYKPLPSTFWPTNGATDDVMIRLDEPLRSDAQGNYSADVYKANLAIVEARVKGLDRISSLPVDERAIGKDLNADGELGVVREITAVDAYVGAAAELYNDSYLYPRGTEFLHTVRYVGIGADGRIGPSRRIKEVRYMRKWEGYRKGAYARNYQLEHYHKEEGRLPHYRWAGDHGLDNGFGWTVSGFIEGVDGELRTLTYEENLFCMGCHTSIGATIDKTFSFPRKVDGAAGWGYIDLVGMPDAPNRGETQGEIATYLERAGGGSEFRHNEEMARKWLRRDGTLDRAAIAGARDVYELITPSVERALALNKAYRVIVAEQDYIYGRDATMVAPANVHRRIDNEAAVTLPASRIYRWDIRLDWNAQPAAGAVANR